MATVPVPITAVVGAILTASEWNAGEEAALAFLLGSGPRLSVYNSTALTPANTSWTLQTWDSEVVDTDSMHSVSVNPSRLTATTAGVYSTFAQVSFTANATGARAIQIRKNSGGVVSGGTQVVQNNSGNAGAAIGAGALCVKDVTMAAGDYLEVFIYQSSGAGLLTYAGDPLTYASMRRVSS